MQFYKVLVSSQRYHGYEPLTYGFGSELGSGTVVSVPMQRGQVLGVVVDTTSKPTFATKQITKIITGRPLPRTSLELLAWLQAYYPAPSGFITGQFLPAGLASTPQKAKPTAAKVAPNKPKTLPPLTGEQQKVVKTIAEAKETRSWLLHGGTGSGKTRVYTEVAAQVLAKGKSVLALTPEIGLAPQLANNLSEALGVGVLVFHSALGSAARRDVWLKILEADKPLVVVGPRSALFSPLKNIGLVVVDEAHEPAYKQEQLPYYYAPRVAGKLAQIHGAKLILGTATPTVAEYYLANAKSVPILRMSRPAVVASGHKVNLKLVNARDKDQFSRHPNLSDALLGGIQTALDKKEQALVFLNRRGSARMVLCHNCGWQALCPVCDLPLIYHEDSHVLRCHTCGHKEPAVLECPVCSSTDIIFKSAGTKAITTSLEKLFPKARIQRFDTDNTSTERLDRHYENILNGNVDILVGTQMLGKGLDLPKLGFVGVVSADTSLSFPDYTSEERTYQMLSQIIGRVGRGHRPGSAVIQTYQPDSRAIDAALNKNWQEFYNLQLAERRQFGFPPFYYLLRLSVARKSQSSAMAAAETLKGSLIEQRFKIKIVGPSPAFYEKSRDKYHWQLVAKAKDRGELIKAINALPANWTYDIDPLNLL